MILRESGMPDQELWEQFFNPFEIFKKFGLTNLSTTGADVACGYGTFTIPLAKLNSGRIYAVDINDDFLTLVDKKTKIDNINTIKVIKADISDPKFHLPEKVSYVLLFNILHCENPESIVRNVIQYLIDDGKLFVIHWRSDIETPRGPPISIRPKMSDIKILMKKLNFQVEKEFDEISPYHYGISFQRISKNQK